MLIDLHTMHGCCGLYVLGPRLVPVPLRHTNVLAKLVDFSVEVEVTQTYMNLTSAPIEAVFIFPLDERAAVCGFDVTVDGKTTQGVVQEKQEARQTYDRAVARGDSAQLLEQKRADVFQMHVGNLQPGQEAAIKITYVADMKIEEDAVRLLVPVSVAPRYHPWTETDPIPRTGTLASSAEGLQLQVVCIMPTKITRVESPSHAVTADLTRGPKLGVVTLQGGATHLEKDFVLLVGIEEPHRPRLAVEKGADGSHACMITLAPKLRLDEVPAEFIFVVDRSGSMGGQKMQQAISAMQLFLRSLPADCYFNIVSFGSRFSLLFAKGSQKNGVETLRSATKEVAAMQADYGGTEILQPLQAVLSASHIRGYERQVFVLTDGQVSNTTELITYIESQNAKCRCFALGLGNDASHELVEGIARAGRGLADFALDGERLEPKVMKQLECAMQPSMQDVHVDWTIPEQKASEPAAAATGGETAAAPAATSGGGVFDAFKNVTGSLLNYVSPRATQEGKLFIQAPHIVPPVFSGARFLIFCLLPPGVAPPTKAVVKAHTPDGVLAVELAPTPADIFEGKVLHTLAARELIRDLEEGRSFMHKGGKASEAAVRAEIVRLGTKYSLMSSQTSFVAVQPGTHQVVPLYYGPIVMPQPQPQPVHPSAFMAPGAVMAPGGGGGMMRMSAPMMAMATAACAPPPPRSSGFFGGLRKKTSSAAPAMESLSVNLLDRPSAAKMEMSSDECEESLGGAMMDFDSFAAPSPPAPKSAPSAASASSSKASTLAAITLLQNFDGSFPASSEIVKHLSVSADALDKVPTSLKGDKSAWATVLVLAFFVKKLADLQDEWSLMAKKARKWVLTKVDAAALAEANTAAEALF